MDHHIELSIVTPRYFVEQTGLRGSPFILMATFEFLTWEPIIPFISSYCHVYQFVAILLHISCFIFYNLLFYILILFTWMCCVLLLLIIAVVFYLTCQKWRNKDVQSINNVYRFISQEILVLKLNAFVKYHRASDFNAHWRFDSISGCIYAKRVNHSIDKTLQF